MRKVLVIAPLTALVLGGFASEVSGQTTATATATYEVAAINEISVSGAPGLLKISNRQQLANGVTDISTTWGVTTNAPATGPMKVTASIDAAMPAGVTLAAQLAAPTTSGTSAGLVSLGTIAANLVTGLSQVDAPSLGVTYKLTATPSAAVGAGTRTVTYTILAN